MSSMFTVKRSVRKNKKKQTQPESAELAQSRPLTQSNMNSNNSIKLFRTKKEISRKSGALNNLNYMSQSGVIKQTNVQTESAEPISKGPIQLLDICEKNQQIQQIIQENELDAKIIEKVLNIVYLKVLATNTRQEEALIRMIEEGLKKYVQKIQCEIRCSQNQSKIDKMIKDRLRKLETVIATAG